MTAKRECKNRNCPEYFYPDNPKAKIRQEWCSEECKVQMALQHYAQQGEYRRQAAEKAQEKARRQQKKTDKKATKEFKRNNRSYQFDLTKREAQRLANKIDKQLPCICCGDPRGRAQFCGGHFKTAKAHSELSLDLRNIHGQQNFNCNKNKSGNIEGDKLTHGYKVGLVKRHGQALLDYLQCHHLPRVYDCEQLILIRALYAAEGRYVDKYGKPSRDWRALDYNLLELISSQTAPVHQQEILVL